MASNKQSTSLTKDLYNVQKWKCNSQVQQNKKQQLEKECFIFCKPTLQHVEEWEWYELTNFNAKNHETWCWRIFVNYQFSNEFDTYKSLLIFFILKNEKKQIRESPKREKTRQTIYSFVPFILSKKGCVCVCGGGGGGALTTREILALVRLWNRMEINKSR